MQRYFSVGVTKLVALMAAHRLAASANGMTSAAFREEVARIDAELQFTSWRAQTAVKPTKATERVLSVAIRKGN